MSVPLSPLERAILQLVADKHWPNFRVDSVRVLRREDTGVGKYVHLDDTAGHHLRDGPYGAGTHYVEMKGIRHGLFFEVLVDNSRLYFIEMATAGGEPWDGVERPWTIK